MSEQELPSAKVAYESLCRTGDQFDRAPLVPQPLGVTYFHPRKGIVAVAADPRVLAACGALYTGDPDLKAALEARRATVHTRQAALRMLDGYFSRSQLIVGVSGFASTGYSCERIASAMSVAYQTLMTTPDYAPSLVCDGATGAGVLGLNGILASQHGVPSLGFAALQGIEDMAPRDHMIIGGQTYEDRERLVGWAPDLLWCFGGGYGSLRECRASLDMGGSVLSVFPNETWPKAMAGPWVDEGRLVFCHEERMIPDALAQIMSSVNRGNRPRRLQAIAPLL